jgi:uncharacterized membrane protein
MNAISQEVNSLKLVSKSPLLPFLGKSQVQIAGLTLLSAILILWDLGSKSFWFDELSDTLNSATPMGDILTGKTDPAQFPFHYLLVHLWRTLFPDSEFSLRFISALPVVASVPFVYLLAQGLFNKKVAFTSTLLAVTSPGVLLFSRMMRYHGWLALLAVISVYTFVLLLEKNSSRLVWLSYVISSVVMAYTHLFGLIFLLGEGLLALLLWQQLRQVFLKWALAVVTIGLLYLPLLISLPARIGAKTGADPVEDPSIGGGLFGFIFRAGYPLYVFIFGETIIPTQVWWVIPGVLAYMGLTIGLGLFLLKSKGWNPERRNVFLMAFLVLFSLVVAAGATSSFIQDQTIGGAAKRVIFLAPFFYIIFCAGLSRLRPVYGYVLLGVLLVVNSVSLYNYYTNQSFINVTYITPWSRITSDIEQNSPNRSATLVLAGDPQIEYYSLGTLPVQMVNPNVLDDGQWEKFKASLIAAPPKQTVVVWRDRGDRPTVERTDDIIQFLKTTLRLTATKDYLARTPGDRSFQKMILRREVPEYYITVYYFQAG